MSARAAPVVTAAAFLVGLAVLLGGNSWRLALRVLLDLLTAAGLLRLAGDQGWAQVAGAAAVVALRAALWRALSAPAPVPRPLARPTSLHRPRRSCSERGR
ncbi:hypothetical protein [Micromonospora okii]|uniref:hypothetical protein n=1 Tax=Micromonospora okii TaxID=1182970 RepID=UPI001E57F500|nr:hypothetical protein [Micromonospora okii]